MKTIAKSIFNSLFLNLFFLSPFLSLFFPVATNHWILAITASTALLYFLQEALLRRRGAQATSRS